MKHLKLFVDTMVFLHYRPLDELKLSEFTNSESITVVVPRVTVQELDKHKSSHRNGKVRDRAKRILNKIENAANNGGELADGFNIELFWEYPENEIACHKLNPQWSDDVLVASIDAYRKQTGHSDVALLSQDTGPRITCRRLGISVFELDESFALSEEVDENEKENRRLKAELAKISDARPLLELVFANDGKYQNLARFKRPVSVNLDENELAEKLSELKKESPLHVITNKNERIVFSALSGDTGRIKDEEWEKYNRQLEAYYLQMEAYFRELHDIAQMRRGATPLILAIKNDGTAPADDVDVKIRFPEGFLLYSEDDLPEDPDPPSPPKRPKSQLDRLFSGSISTAFLPPITYRYTAPDLENLVSFRIHKSDGYFVTDHFRRIKHGCNVALPKMFVAHHPNAEFKSFKFDYEIRPANTPNAFQGQLHFIAEMD